MLVEEKLASPEAVDAALSRQKALRSRRFGEYLTENQIVSPEQLAAALKQQRGQPIQKLGETLVELGYLTESELDEALAIEARDRSVPLGQILADMGVVDAEVVNAVIARKLGIPYVSLKTFRIPPEVLKRIPAAVAQRFQTLPVAESDNALVVAIENPMDIAKLEELRFVVGSKLLPVMASGEDIRAALERAYGDARAVALAEVRKRIDVGIGELTHRLAAETADAAIDETQSLEQDNTLVQLVNKMIIDAVGAEGLRHPHRGQPGRQGHARALPQGRRAGHLPRPAGQVPQGGGLAPEDHGAARHHRAAQAAGRQDRVPPLRPARRRSAHRHHPDHRRAGRHRDARARRRDAGRARRARLRRRAAPGAETPDLAAARPVSRVRPDRLREDHHPAFAAAPHSTPPT